MTKHRKTRTLGNTEVEYRSDYYVDLGFMDTEVIINDEVICVIEGTKIEEFHEKLNELIETYRI